MRQGGMDIDQEMGEANTGHYNPHYGDSDEDENDSDQHDLYT